MGFAVLFPGQGSQSVGMGADLFDARPDLLGERSDDALGWSLRDLCLDGSSDQLTRTDRAQPALFALSYALWDSLRAEGLPLPHSGAGHSLGEYTALAAAGAFSFDDGLRLVAARGAAMALAADAEPSGMAALLGAEVDHAEAVAEKRRGEGGRLWVANINAPGQVVVAGAQADIDWLTEQAERLELRRVIRLDVAGAFHSPMMETAAGQLGTALAQVEMSELLFPIWANATARPHGSNVAESLVAQLTSPVLFADSLSSMADDDVDLMLHVGPGDVTVGMAKRSTGSSAISVSALADMGPALAQVARSIE